MPTKAADASFELLARRTLGTVPEFFEVEAFRVMVERRFDANGKLKTVSEAVVKLVVDGTQTMSVAEGHGPVNALDLAMRKDLGKYQGEIEDLELVDYKVRILNGGTEAITRVLIELIDGAGERWWTVGVSDNIIDASFQALMDSIVFKLMKSRDATGRAAAEKATRESTRSIRIRRRPEAPSCRRGPGPRRAAGPMARAVSPLRSAPT